MGKLNMDAMKTKLDAESRQSYSNTDYDKLQDGKNVRRVLWPKGDKESFYSEGYLHFGLGSDGHSVATCPKTFSSKNRCPICEYVEQLQQSKSKDDKKLAGDIKAKRRIYINVLSRDDEEETPKVLPIGVTILKGILEAICDPDYGDITDPEEGHDITITRKGKGINTEYSVLPKPKATKFSDELEESEVEEEMVDLDSLFIEKSYEELEAILNGEDEDDSDDEDEGDEDEKPSRKSSKSKDDEDEDEGDYDDMELEDLQEECDARGIKYSSKASKVKLIALLTEYDAADEDNSDDEEESSEDEDEEDDVKDAIAAAIAKRKGKK